jgi:sugar transferase (PEP-CTERM/EpsH1 system associated)
MRTFQLLKALAQEHTVSLLALADEAEHEAATSTLLADRLHRVRTIASPSTRRKRVRQLLHLVRGQSDILVVASAAKVQEALDELLSQDHYEVVLCEEVFSAGYRIPADIKVIIDQHNIEHELRWRTYQHERAWRLRKWYNWRESRLLRPVELERCQRADVVLVTSDRELRLLGSLLPRLPKGGIHVVPNGVDVGAFRPSGLQQEVPGRIIFTGNFAYFPNVSGALFFAQQCWPIIRAHVPDATWQIVGCDPTPEIQRLAALPGITVTGAVPAVQPYLAAASVAVAPLYIGSGTRLKVLEALAMRKAVVSTRLGCEGLSVVPGEHLLVEDQPQALAQAVIVLLRDPSRRAALGTSGRALIEEQYNWDSCGARILTVLDEMAREESWHL